MKSLINSKFWAMLTVAMVLSVSSALADETDFLLSVRNVTHTSTTIGFDLYLLDTDNTQTFEFAALQLGILLNSSIYGSGTLTVTYSNAGSGLDGDQQFVNVTDVVTSLAGYDGKTLIRLMPNSIPPVPPGAGSGTVISSAGYGTLLAHFTIESTVSFTANSRAGLEFCSGIAVSPLYPTILYSYINGDSTPLPVTPGADAIVDGDPLLNATLPVVFNVTGGGTYCQGDDGLPVGLDGSELNTTYTLYRNSLEVSNLPGTGNPLSFGNQAAGIYTVIATNEAGDQQMNGTAELTAVINTVTPPSSTPTLCINTALTPVTHTTTGATGIGTATGLPGGVTANWASNTITISGTPTASGIFNYSIPLTGGCGTVNATGTITVNALPSAAGPITGPAAFTPGTSGTTYSVSPITSATSYLWSYSGTGVTINGAGNSVTLDFSVSATPGTLSVFGRNSCGDGAASTLNLTAATKTLNLTSVLLEGLYNGSGTMREASNGFAPQYPGIADRIRVELHQDGNYSTIIFAASEVELSITGTATLPIPAEYSGNYYITIKHRNSIETTTSTPVSFAGVTVNQSFASRANVFGDNLKFSGDGYYLIYGADVNQDGIVDTGDMNDVDNGSAAILIGYNLPDANGDGLVDTSDMNMVDNNSAAIVYIRIPN